MEKAMGTELLKGTLDLLILRTLTLGPRHGLDVSRRIEQVTKGTFEVKPGSLFPALHRLEQQGFVTAEWGETEGRKRAKYYRLTRKGRKQGEAQTANWKRVAKAMARAIEATS